MKYRSWKVLALAVGMMTAAVTVNAAYISGSIQFGNGSITIPGSSLDSAGGISGYQGVLGPSDRPSVLGGSQTGNYLAVPGGTKVDWSPFSFGDTSFLLWQLTTPNGDVFSFKATTLSIVQQNENFLDIKGEGVASITGFTDTPGTWTITVNNLGSQFTFGASTTVPGVPDGGNTVWLLGTCLLGIMFVQKIMNRSQKPA